MIPLLQEFIAESREQMERSVAELADLEREPGNLEALNALFRTAHTIKGSCRLFNLDPVARLVSAMEDLLDAAREQEMVLDHPHLEVLQEGFDTLEGWLDDLEERSELPPQADEGAQALVEAIRRSLGQKIQAEPAAGPAILDPAVLREVDEEVRARLWCQYADKSLAAILYEPEPECFYTGEDPLYTARSIPGICALAIVPTEPWPDLLELDVYRCRLRLYAFSTAPAAQVAEAMGKVPGLVAVGPISLAQLAVPEGNPGTTPEAAAAAREALQRLDEGHLDGVRQAVAAVSGEGQPWLASTLRWIERLAAAPKPDLAAVRDLLRGMAEGRPADSRPGAAAQGTDSTAGRAGAARKLLSAQAGMLAGGGDAALSAGRLLSGAAVVRSCARALGRDDLTHEIERAGAAGDGEALARLIEGLLALPEASAAPAPAPEPAAPAPAPIQEPTTEQVRIELRQLDRLMDLVAELVVAKNSLPYLAQQAEAQGLRDFSRSLKACHGTLHRIVDEMQSTMGAVRLVPLGHGFRRLPRLARDAARRVRKEVELILEGESVEADRRVVDALGEPLVHLVRNAIDHGIESPEERMASGKPRTGKLRVAARTEGDQLVVEISDDGRGIDIEAVKRQAYERGLVAEENLESLGEEAVVQFLFQAGFSTRGTVTEMSGRGVGLDAVRAAVQSLGGRVSLGRNSGPGTRAVLVVPLSMATAEVMMVDAAGQRFGVPVSLIAHMLKLPRIGVRQVKRRRAFTLRGKVVPLLAARDVLGLPPRDGEGDLSVVVARLGDALVGLEVDRFSNVAEVVMRPLDGVLAGMPQYAGSAVLADGSILLVLDLLRLVSHAHRV